MKIIFVFFLAQSGSSSFLSLPYVNFMEDQKDLLGHVIISLILHRPEIRVMSQHLSSLKLDWLQMPETSLHSKDLAAKRCLNAKAESVHRCPGQEMVSAGLDRSGRRAPIILGQWMSQKEGCGVVNLTCRQGGGKVTCNVEHVLVHRIWSTINF